MIIFKSIEVTSMQSSPIQKCIEFCVITTKIIPTAAVILFCITCHIIANQFKNIELQIEEMANIYDGTAELLERLRKQYSLGIGQ